MIFDEFLYFSVLDLAQPEIPVSYLPMVPMMRLNHYVELLTHIRQQLLECVVNVIRPPVMMVTEQLKGPVLMLQIGVNLMENVFVKRWMVLRVMGMAQYKELALVLL